MYKRQDGRRPAFPRRHLRRRALRLRRQGRLHPGQYRGGAGTRADPARVAQRKRTPGAPPAPAEAEGRRRCRQRVRAGGRCIIARHRMRRRSRELRRTGAQNVGFKGRDRWLGRNDSRSAPANSAGALDGDEHLGFQSIGRGSRPTRAKSSACLQQLQHGRGRARLAQSRKDLLHAVAVRVGATVRHRVCDQRHVVAVVVGAARGRFDAAAGRDAGDDDLSHAAAMQVVVQGRADEGAQALLAHDEIARLPVQFGHEVGPVVRERQLGNSGLGAARCQPSHIDEHDRQAARAEGARQLRTAIDDLVHRVHGRQADVPFCRSIRIRVALASSCVRGMAFLSLADPAVTLGLSLQTSRSTAC